MLFQRSWDKYLLWFLQEEYYATHQCFLTNRSLYLLVWNIQDGEKGLRSLKPWLENIESCAPQAPVIIVGTHYDLIPAKEREKMKSNLENRISQIYSPTGMDERTYPTISQNIHLLDVRNTKQIDNLRDEIYYFALRFQPSKLDTHFDR